jgi:hypothetical protein
MTWVEQHAHARHWVFRELDRLIDQRSRTEHNEQLHHNRAKRTDSFVSGRSSFHFSVGRALGKSGDPSAYQHVH